jgi:Na+/H+ antiporter NhaB
MYDIMLISITVLIYVLIACVICSVSGLIVWYATKPRQIKKVIKQYNSNTIKLKYKNIA